MYRVEGDGSYQRTVVWKDGEPISYDYCTFRIDPEECTVDVDGEEGHLDRMVISGVYMIISDGNFSNSRIMVSDEALRGVRKLVGHIDGYTHPTIEIEAVLLPNIVEDVE